MSEDQPPKGCFVGCLAAAVIVVALVAVMFVSLFYFGFVERGGVYDGLRVQLARSQLNQLVPFVEMYRARRGAYPERIEQVAEIIPPNTPVSIYDTTIVHAGDQARLFYYERVGEAGYILRGLGGDGEAFTDDDIVPDGYPPGSSGLLLERPPPPAAPDVADPD